MSESIFCLILTIGNEIQSGIGGLCAVKDYVWHNVRCRGKARRLVQRLLKNEEFFLLNTGIVAR